ncbi:SDR family oxidoreductase [Maritimibacter sp. UBA3975]|uniref:SDR family NAD(P)-dependent oxidoreductase n=1 Tax=Maritimibacter sp. UBA3975 TaxID=1946833 RepID=UPI000C0925E1|nr:SDR family oxidoreductase [Maritimibacter sp. UBA3975]MAM61333.1 3-ketoacyl-ACP reductase [Maritimibacter sp.]|tara:strand:- start:4786 stop:5547 length:762 start_codon:yes stop_codon:yes gene_type:complete
MDLGLKGMKAAVTGGSRGIGKSIATLLAEEGCDVSICARGEEAIAATRAEIEGHGVRSFGAALQGRDGDSVRQWTRDTCESFGGLDLLVCSLSAGGGTNEERYWYRSFEIDLMSATRAVEEAYPHLKKSDNASILIISSMAAAETFVSPMAYNSMKAALVTWSKQLAEQYAPKGIRVNCLQPGPTMFPGSNWEMIKVARSRTYSGVLRQQPTRRMAEAEEIARSAVFLASPAAQWVTGATLRVDGGYTKGVQF